MGLYGAFTHDALVLPTLPTTPPPPALPPSISHPIPLALLDNRRRLYSSSTRHCLAPTTRPPPQSSNPSRPPRAQKLAPPPSRVRVRALRQGVEAAGARRTQCGGRLGPVRRAAAARSRGSRDPGVHGALPHVRALLAAPRVAPHVYVPAGAALLQAPSPFDLSPSLSRAPRLAPSHVLLPPPPGSRRRRPCQRGTGPSTEAVPHRANEELGPSQLPRSSPESDHRLMQGKALSARAFPPYEQ
ncbi:unnamed protein product [Urochloa humidicola]